ncbi:MAG: DUF192 domain-containing protein, partial [Xanthobacteraceae bacterium]|nr:DUF192 domain-containing protein [Xanthobacteraceae bacterium]
AAFVAWLTLAVAPTYSSTIQTLKIVSGTKEYPFTVEVVATPDERARGLMERREVPTGTGMLFDFQTEQPVAFWMKNTIVSLDMIFIRANGTILNIATDTVPFSEKQVPSDGPVRGVLEVVAGTTKKLGISPGDKVIHPIFTAK